MIYSGNLSTPTRLTLRQIDTGLVCICAGSHHHENRNPTIAKNKRVADPSTTLRKVLFNDLVTRFVWCVIWFHDNGIKWKHFPRYCPFVRVIHRSPVNSLHKGQWRGALMFSLIWAWITTWVNNRGDLRRHRAHYDVIVTVCLGGILWPISSQYGSF